MKQPIARCQELGEGTLAAACLQVFAGIALDQQALARAARLYGATAALREAVGYPVAAADRAFYQRDLAAPRAQADHDLLAALQAGEYCYVLNSRQMGKSSLCVRTMARLREEGIRTAFLDLTKFGGRNLTAEQWYAALLAEMGRELGLRAECLAY